MKSILKKILGRVMLLFVVGMMVSCGDDNPTPVKKDTITLDKTTVQNQVCWADDTQGESAITFNASTDWSAVVREVETKSIPQPSIKPVDWLTLSAYAGGAGKNSLIISLKKNETGNDRSAEVTITAGKSVLTLTIVQKSTKKGEASEGDVKGLVTKVTCKSWYENKDDGEYTVEFFYDQQGRVTRITQTETNEYDTPQGEAGTVLSKAEVTLTYGSGTASYYMAYSEDGMVNPNHWVKGSAKLDAQGRVLSGEYTDKDDDDEGDNEECYGTYTLTYDANGYLVKSEGMDGDDPLTETLKWDAGNLIEVNRGTEDGRELVDRVVYGSVKNNGNVDLNWLFVLSSEGFDFSTGDPNKVFAVLGLTGKRTANMPTKVTETWGDVDTFTYETTEKGVLTKITSKTDDGRSRDEYVITYGK